MFSSDFPLLKLSGEHECILMRLVSKVTEYSPGTALLQIAAQPEAATALESRSSLCCAHLAQTPVPPY